jgi:hypothetical protein
MKPKISLGDGAPLVDLESVDDVELIGKWSAIEASLDAEIRHRVFEELWPCTHKKFLSKYVELAGVNVMVKW